MAAYDFLIKEKDEQIDKLVNALSISMADPLPHPGQDTPQVPNKEQTPSSPWLPGKSPAPSRDDKLAHHRNQLLQIGPGQPSNPWDTYGPLPPIPNPAGEGWGEPAQPPGGHEKYELQPGWWKNDMQISGNPFGYSDEYIHRSKTLYDIINDRGTDPSTLKNAQKQWIKLQQTGDIWKRVDAGSPDQNIAQVNYGKPTKLDKYFQKTGYPNKDMTDDERLKIMRGAPKSA